jgi:hypothetical protein
MRRARHVVQPERVFLCARSGPRGAIWLILANNVESGDHRIAIDDGGGELEANVKVAD